jgi:hypothetical protein
MESVRATKRMTLDVIQSTAGQEGRDLNNAELVGESMTELVDAQSGFRSREVSRSCLSCQCCRNFDRGKAENKDLCPAVGSMSERIQAVPRSCT